MQDLQKLKKRNYVKIRSGHLSLITAALIAILGFVFALGVMLGSSTVREPECLSVDPLAKLDKSSKEPVPKPQPKYYDLSFFNSLDANKKTVSTASPADEIEKQEISGKIYLEQPKHSESPIPEKVPHDVKGIYTLQVGSYANQVHAAQMVKKLQNAGYNSFLVSVNMPERGGIWYRVRVGPYTNKKEAWNVKETFEKNEKIPAFVVKRKIRS